MIEKSCSQYHRYCSRGYRGVRHISINDNFDTSALNDKGIDMAGIKNCINEFYAHDISHKIRAVNKFEKR